MEVRLRGNGGPYDGQEIILRDGQYRVGRGEHCAVLLVKEATVSVDHALLVVRRESALLLDRGSRNGTFINDVKLALPTVLETADCVRFGTSEWAVELAVDPAPAALVEDSDVDAAAPLDVLTESTPIARFEELPPRLVVMDGSRRGEVLELPADAMFVAGRGHEAQLMLEDPFCSRQHATFLWRGSRVVVRDNQSRNGVLVNYRKTLAAELRSGDVVAIGRTRLRFVAPGEALPTTDVGREQSEDSTGGTLVPDLPEEAVEQPEFGPYRVVGEVGRGGMGRVFEARTVGHARVALKLLRVKGLSEARLGVRRQRFEREARVLQLIRHENVVAYRDHGQVNGQPYLAMEMVDGPDLLTVLRAGQQLAYTEVERILFQLCAAVSAVHEAAVVHRDLKPGNIILHGEARTVKLTDFGIARRSDDRDLEGDEEALTQVDEEELTPEGRHPGTPFYMSPEQVRGEMLDMRSDIWALGVILYQLVAGGRPFDGPTGRDVMNSIVADCPKPLPDDVPGYVRSVVYRCLLKPPSWRFGSAIELMDALHERRVEQPAPVGVEGPPPIPLTQCPFCGAGIAVGRDKCPVCRTDLNVFLEGHMLHLSMDGRFYAVCGSCGMAASTTDRVCRRCGRMFRARQTAAQTLHDENLTEEDAEALAHALVKLRNCPYCAQPVDTTRPQCASCGLHLRAFLTGRMTTQPDAKKIPRAHCGSCGVRLPDPGMIHCASCGLNFVTGRMTDGKPWRQGNGRPKRKRR